MWYKVINRHCGPFRDNSKNLAVRMMEEEYGLLQKFMSATKHGVTLYFRKLIAGDQLIVRNPDIVRRLHAENNKIYNNIMQILRAGRKQQVSAQSLRELEFLVYKLSEEVGELAFLR